MIGPQDQVTSLLNENRLIDALDLIAAHVREAPDSGYGWVTYSECLHRIGRRRDAITAAKKALDLAPDKSKPGVRLRLANLYMECRMYEAAETSFKEVILSAEMKQFDWLWHFRGKNLLNQELFEEALACFEKAAALDPSNEDHYYKIGFVLRALGRYDEAATATKACLSLVPNAPETLELLRSLPLQNS